MRRIAVVGLILLLPLWGMAHRIDLDCSAEGNALLIESWTDGNAPVVDGEVTITSQDGTIRVSGKTDPQGCFRWTPTQIEALTITIYAGEGHKKSMDISEEQLRTLLAETSAPSEPVVAVTSEATSVQSDASAPASRRTASLSTHNAFGAPERVVIGLTFLAAGAAAWMSYRNGRKLDEFIRSQTKH